MPDLLNVSPDSISVPPGLNPRKGFGEDDLRELVDSIRQLGILQPLLVRPTHSSYSDGHLELVAGERRLRAARQLGLKEVPVQVLELDDAQAAQARLVENLQREDLTTLEEADGLLALHVVHKLSAAEISAKVGKSVSYVYARMKLAEFPPDLRMLVAPQGPLSDSIALLIARLDGDHARREAAARLAEGAKKRLEYGSPMTYRDAFRIIQEDFALRLAGAPWNKKDVALHGGACSACPKRTGSDPDLFGDLEDKRGDCCRDKNCYALKLAEHRERAAARITEKGYRLVAPKELMEYGHVSSKYIDLKDPCHEAPAKKGGNPPSWAEVLGDVDPKVVVACVDEAGEVRRAIPRRQAWELAAATGKKWARETAARHLGSSATSRTEDERKRARIATAKREALRRSWADIEKCLTNKTDGVVLNDAQWEAIVRSLWDEVWHESKTYVLKAHGIDGKKSSGMLYHAAPPAQLLGPHGNQAPTLALVLVQLLLARHMKVPEYAGEQLEPAAVRLCNAFGLGDVKEYYAEARKEAKKAEGKAAKAAKPAKGKTAKKGGKA